LRTARKSVGGLDNSSEGGCGGAMVAHAMLNSSAAIAGSAFRASFMQKKTD
jgi:hypothetical protein